MPPDPVQRLRTARRRARARREPPAVVLLYHRVATPPSDPQLLCAAPERFERHMAVLARRYRPLSLAALLEALSAGRVPERAVAVTFDDGYADNLHAARPVLERHGVPATVYVTTGHLDARAEFWWDELERLLLLPGRLPQTLRVTIEGCERSWSLGGAAAWSEADACAHRRWSVLESADPTPRHRAYRALHAALRPLPASAREEALGSIRTQAGVAPAGRETHRALTRGELRALARGGLVEIGAHTVTHPVLAAVSHDSQRAEIEGSRDALAAELGAPPRTFAYPFGGARDFTGSTAALVGEAGFASSVTTAPVPAWPDTDPMRVPRFLVRDWDEAVFERALERFFGGG